MEQRQIDAALDACYDAIVNPDAWSGALHRLARSVDAVCCMFYPQCPQNLTKMPASPDFVDFLEEFVRDGWWLNDYRADRGWPLLEAGRTVILEHDVASEDDRKTKFAAHLKLHLRYGLPWWAAVGMTVNGRRWAMPFLRSAGQGPFTSAEAERLKGLIPHLRRMLSLTQKLAFDRIGTSLEALDRVRCAALALDWRGMVIRMNNGAERLIGDGLRLVGRRLEASDRESNVWLERVTHAAIVAEAASAFTAPGPVAIRRAGKRPLVVEAIPATGLFADVLRQARVLLLVIDLEEKRRLRSDVLRSVLGLSPAEARLLARLAGGDDLETAAAKLGIATVTARNELKSVFAKTDTHRQSELVALAARLGGL